MDRHGEEDRRKLAHMVALLLSLAAMATAAGSLPPARRVALLAVLHDAAAVAFAFVARIHAPLVHPRDMPGPDAAARLAITLYALACALAVRARQAIQAARWLRHRGVDRFGAASPPAIPQQDQLNRPGFQDTS